MLPLILTLLAACGGERPSEASDDDDLRVPVEALEEAVRPEPQPPEEAPDAPVAAPHALREIRVAPRRQRIRRTPSEDARLRGLLAADVAFEVFEHAPPTPGCGEPGWGRVGPEGWTCLVGTTLSPEPPEDQPVCRPFDFPRPEEERAYRRDGTWPMAPAWKAPSLLPFVYARRSGRPGTVYATLDDASRGVEDDRLDPVRAYAFDALVQTGTESLLALPDEAGFVPLDEVRMYAVSRFGGLDLASSPAPDGADPAFVVARDGLPVRSIPRTDAEVVGRVPYHDALWTDVSGEGPAGWVRVQAMGGPSEAEEALAGWARWREGLRRWIPAPPPEDVGDALWVDVELTQQTVALRRGAEVVYLTLTSTGTWGHETPTGLFRISDKIAWWDMGSRQGADEYYYVESVPWVMHYWPRFALHGAFWHDGFGRPRSHGCVNLAPRDASAVFDAVSPSLPTGWLGVWETPSDPGSRVRVREGADVDVRDRRGPLR